MTEKIWQVKSAVPQELVDKFPEIKPLVLQMLYNRGLATQREIDEFFSPDYQQGLFDPFLFKDAVKAAKRIWQAKQNNELVVVYGDYDADGVCASATVVTLLQALEIKNDIYIPYRETEGYGLNEEAVKKIIAQGAKLVITVDCGITNNAEVSLLQNSGVDVILTDHHEPPPNLPPAFAIMNPKIKHDSYPFADLCGAGVAFKLVCATQKYLKENNLKSDLPEGWEKWLLDLTAIATVADIMPLIGENRTLVTWGLVVLQKTKRLGLRELVSLIGEELSEMDVRAMSWQIAPRLNAAGRLNHASTAYKLLITQEASEAAELAAELQQNNLDRQKMTELMNEQAKNELASFNAEEKLIAVISGDWPLGLVGLLAGRLSDKFNRPALVVTKNPAGEYVGSGRSIPAFNLIAAINECSEFLLHAGGHSQAAGFTIKNQESLQKFLTKIKELAKEKITADDLKPVLEIEAEVDLQKINWELWDEVEKFQPYGENNPAPIFAAYQIKIEGMQTLGQNNKHLRLMVSHRNGKKIYKTIGFSLGDWAEQLKVGELVDLAFELGLNEWNGNRELQLKIMDIKKVKKENY